MKNGSGPSVKGLEYGKGNLGEAASTLGEGMFCPDPI
jgi:hypothetical protein